MDEHTKHRKTMVDGIVWNGETVSACWWRQDWVKLVTLERSSQSWRASEKLQLQRQSLWIVYAQ